MKISNKEKIMLFVLGIIIVGLGYYNFIYSYQVSQIQKKLKQENEVKQKYTAAMETIKSIENRKSDVKILKAKIGDESVPFYPTISEEHIIIELDKLLKESGLNGGISFKPIVTDSVENPKKEKSSLAESSFQGIVDKYNNIVKDDDNTQDSSNKNSNNKSNSTANDKNSNNNFGITNTNNNSNSNVDDTKDKKNTVEYLKCEVKFEGKYEALDKLFNAISINEKKIVVNSIKISQDTLDEVVGTIELEIYSIPKITDELEDYLRWDYNNIYGKNVPFSKGSATGIADSNKDISDFVATVKSINSDLPTVMIGKTDDYLRTTYIYADNNSEEKVEMILTQDGDKYYYKYKTSKGTFPVNYDGLGAEFVPKSGNIVLNILSEG